MIPLNLSLSPSEVVKASIKWLGRIEDGGISDEEATRLRRVFLPAKTEDPGERKVLRQRARFSQLNLQWNRSSSARTHRRLTENKSEWQEYHDLYRQARQDWEKVPAHIFAQWLDDRQPGRVVADLGCGEMLLAERCQTSHDIRGFDHVAVDDRVTECDIAQVPMADGTADIAVLSLALMGSNQDDYVAEAHRLLHVDGQLWLAEPAGRIGTDEQRVRQALFERGFAMFHWAIEGKFVVVGAVRSPGVATPSGPLLERDSIEQYGGQGLGG